MQRRDRKQHRKQDSRGAHSVLRRPSRHHWKIKNSLWLPSRAQKWGEKKHLRCPLWQSLLFSTQISSSLFLRTLTALWSLPRHRALSGAYTCWEVSRSPTLLLNTDYAPGTLQTGRCKSGEQADKNPWSGRL